ncbi:facilitated trehalose transporter Tret1-like [Photinus pyralis]|uniref:facilitated trehalose transporter Tret1-like n=1 Tax=Photinus pyralis TaxID=7054 RepID=UPI0012671BD8|nr:facilitated trehalose transporter Tret1-like [Photinus pyralis]
MTPKGISSKSIGIFRQFFATACLGPLTYGADMGWSSPVLPRLESLGLTVNESSWIGAMLAIGVFITAIPSGYLADRFGVKSCTIASAVTTLIATVIMFLTSNFYWLCVARFLAGVTIGGVSVVGPMYISEISDVEQRGTLGSFFELMIYLGVFLVTVCGAYVKYFVLNLIVGILTLTTVIIVVFLPESPTYLMSLGKQSDAEMVFKFYRGCNIHADNLLRDARGDIGKTSRKHLGIGKSLYSKGTTRGFIACIGLSIFQQLSGVDTFVLYSVPIFEMSDSDIDAYTSGIVIAAVQMCASGVAVFIVERVRRRLLLFISTIGSGLSLALLGAYFHMETNNVSLPGFNAVPVVSFAAFSLSYAVGLGPVLWMICGELFSEEIKVGKIFPVAATSLGPHYTFYFFAVCMVACIVFIKFCIPETKDKTLEEIQRELNA